MAVLEKTGERETETALHWILEILRKNNVPFQISGGFAARLYGATRPLADIDIDIAEDGFDTISPQVRPYLTYGPARYVDEQWDLKLMTLSYRGQEIDLSGDALIFDKNEGAWCEKKIDFTQSSQVAIYGDIVPVIPIKDLVEYKSKLLRTIDIRDLEEIQRN